MVAALNETLLDESRVPAVVADVQALIDAEVSDKSGASGLALKGGYGAVKKVGPSIVPDASRVCCRRSSPSSNRTGSRSPPAVRPDSPSTWSHVATRSRTRCSV